jgi:hypothetical protein
VIEQAQDIVAILSESGVRTRRERAAFVARLRDEMGLTWGEIGRQLNATPQRAQQLYMLNRFFQQSANSPFANLSTRARNFLNNLAQHVGLPTNWEQDPAQIAKLVHALRNTQRREALKFRNLGARTMREIEDFMRQKGLSFMEAEDDEDDGIVPKDFTAPAAPDEVMQKVVEFLNQHGFRGQFKMWPKGTYAAQSPEYDFTMTVSDFFADAWEEHWDAFKAFDPFLASMGYEYDVAGEPGDPQRTFHFFKFSEA